MGTKSGETAGETEPQSSPAGSRPAGEEGDREAGPSPQVGMAEGGAPRDSASSATLLPGQAAAAARGPGAMHTFMTEKQLEWREAGETHDYLGRITGRGLGGPHGPNPEVTGGGPKRGSE